jgi:raffinose/stachyose/melibiose transport system substrate-binding protein
MVEPYDYRISLFKEGYLVNIGGIDAIDADEEHYDEFALSAWSTDEGELFALPLAAVSHGFIYNKTKFDELGFKAPKTTDEFFALCKQIEDAGYVALAMGSADEWVANVYGYSIVAPTFTKGEEGRQGLINKTAKFTDEGFLDAWKFLDGWKEYMPEGYEGIGYSDMTTMFSTGQALMMSAGSWDVSVMGGLVGDSFEVAGFQTPVMKEGDDNYVCFHPDNALALNAASPDQEAAIEFLQWTTTEEFAKLWNNALPGFFTLSKHSVELSNPLAQEMFSWATIAKGASPRIAYQYISRGDFNTDSEIARLTTLMFMGELTPEEVATQVQEGFDKSYTPVK